MADLTGMLQAAAGAVAPTDYEISRSLRVDSASSAYLTRTPSSTTNRRTCTISFWIKRTSISATRCVFSTRSGSNFYYEGFFNTDDTFTFRLRDGSATEVGNLTTTQVFRDTSAWYHFVVAMDTTQSTASDRIKLYVNGTQITAFGTETYPSQDFDSGANVSGYAFRICNFSGVTSAANNFNGYITEIHFIDGQSLAATNFGKTNSITGIWQPKAYASTYGTNGFFLNFSDNSGVTAATLGADSSGNGNNWTPTNFSVTAGLTNDSFVDTPTPYGEDTGLGGEVRGNYCILNRLFPFVGLLKDGNLVGEGTDPISVRGNMAVSSGKWYVELTIITRTTGVIDNSGNGKGIAFGVTNGTLTTAYNPSGTERIDSVDGGTWGIPTADGQVLGAALDVDAQTLEIFINGSSQGSKSFTATGEFFFAFFNRGDPNDPEAAINFGQRPFAYTAPSGFKALCTQNLPTPTVVQGDDYFNTVLYTGTGSSQSITGVGFQPDWVWIKERSGAADHGLYDAVRGVTKQLESNNTAAETTEATGLTAFGSDGFTVGALAQLNTNTDTYVAWNWNAGGSNATNTDGTITSTVRANPTAGFSIVSYTGTGSAATVGHGLGIAPSVLLVKERDNADQWHCGFAALGFTKYIHLDLTNAAATSSTVFNDTAPTSSVFSIGTSVGTNRSGGGMIAYVFAEVESFSKFGSYTGNGSANGPFVFTNHKPAFLLVKRTDSTSNWTILDLKREGYNVDNDPLYPNLSNAEGTTDLADILSNGFKLRSTDASVNASGGTYIFMAFAENPFKYSLAR